MRLQKSIPDFRSGYFFVSSLIFEALYHHFKLKYYNEKYFNHIKLLSKII